MSPDNQTPATPAKETSAAFELLSGMKSEVAGPAIIGEVVASVRKARKDKAVTEKATQLATALDNFVAIDRALKNIKPKPTGFDADGKGINECYTKEQTEERKKLKESFDKAHKALNLALTGDFSKLGEIKAPAGGKASESASDESAS